MVHEPRAKAPDLLVGRHSTECDLAQALHRIHSTRPHESTAHT
jgi:hypothetical protein